MEKYLEISSQGEIDVEAFTLIGASTKTNDDTKIGMFGSGNKYAISALMRSNIKFRVFSGENEIKFESKKRDFRGQEFNVIYVNGSETSLTTTMGGKDWDNSFAPIREIYSNALDEDSEASIKSVSKCVGIPGYTRFLIELTEDVNHFFKMRHLYFCNTNPKVLHSSEYGSIFKNEIGGIRLFRKGILSFTSSQESNQKSVFYYNLNDISINESRVITSQWRAKYEIAKIIKSCDKIDVVKYFIDSLKGGNAGYYEHELDYSHFSDFNNVWYDLLKDKKLVPAEGLILFDSDQVRDSIVLPIKLLRSLVQQFPDLNVMGMNNNGSMIFNVVEPSEILINKVIDSMKILNNSRYKPRISGKQIKYADFKDTNVLGYASEGIIYLSTKLDCEDVYTLSKIIIEENEHNISGFGDETREFQNHLFNLYFDELISQK